jgi:hypothetical protein
MARKEPEQPERLVRICEVIAEAGGGGSNPSGWLTEAEELAATMPALVVRDWRGHACVDWTHAERLYLAMLRDRQQVSREQSERLAAIEASQRGHVPGVSFEDPASTAKAEVY